LPLDLGVRESLVSLLQRFDNDASAPHSGRRSIFFPAPCTLTLDASTYEVKVGAEGFGCRNDCS
jgi:hypothetical protein